VDAQQFAYWLQGFVELTGGKTAPTTEQWKMICEHLALVFKKVTPPLEQQKAPALPPYTPSQPVMPGPAWPDTYPKITCTVC